MTATYIHVTIYFEFPFLNTVSPFSSLSLRSYSALDAQLTHQLNKVDDDNDDDDEAAWLSDKGTRLEIQRLRVQVLF